MQVYVYLLFSPNKNRFYVGCTNELNKRILEHNTGFYKKYSTHFTSDCELYYSLQCETLSLALKIEKHIKRMRNRMYFANLVKYPEIGQKLLIKYG